MSLGIKFTKLPESFIPCAQCLVHYKLLVDKKSKLTSSSTTILNLTSPELQIILPEVVSPEPCIVLLYESFVVGSDVSCSDVSSYCDLGHLFHISQTTA